MVFVVAYSLGFSFPPPCGEGLRVGGLLNVDPASSPGMPEGVLKPCPKSSGNLGLEPGSTCCSPEVNLVPDQARDGLWV